MIQDLTEERYREMFVPFGGFLFIEKDTTPEKTTGGIILASTTKEGAVKWGMTGTILQKAPLPPSEEQWQTDLWNLLRVGDKVGFSSTTPILSPCPPYYRFETGIDKQESKFVVFHVADVLGILLETDQQREAFSGRVSEALGRGI